jgi:hypothetical protein
VRTVDDFQSAALWLTFAANNPEWEIGLYTGSSLIEYSLLGDFPGHLYRPDPAAYWSLGHIQFDTNRIMSVTTIPATQQYPGERIIHYDNGSAIHIHQMPGNSPDEDRSTSTRHYNAVAYVGFTNKLYDWIISMERRRPATTVISLVM